MDNTASLGLIDSLLVMVIGMIIVFVGLVVLIALITVMAKLTSGISKKTAPTPVQAPKAAPAAVSVEEISAPDDTPLVAAIMAANAVVMEGSEGFTVRRIRRVNNTPAWQNAGRRDQIGSRF